MTKEIDLPRILNILEWHTPATDYPEKQIGNWRIKRFRQNRGYYQYWGMDGYLFWHVTKPIWITHLQEYRGTKWHTWMIDDPPQYRAMEIYADGANGKTLTTGLGLGLILHELVNNPKVTAIQVVELSGTVAELITGYIPNTPICFMDFYNFIKMDYISWDTIIVDLWVSRNKKEKLRLFYEVLRLHLELIQKYPQARITYHGFQSISAIKTTSDDMVKLIQTINK